ncbi:TRAP transporter TatT component family protein [Limnohabitans sp.]|uniref:TRAP transporter TatT component family protein n=1 Tax=Limnohabitans sp. TaxID=1907725 RepID=UPI00286F9D2A|nr:TRAP transporter TatT component family protein [Limnohabitans sp.]
MHALSACAIRPYVVDQAAQALSHQDQTTEEDLVLVREASAFYLKMSESLLRESPGNLKLAQSVAAGFTQYAYAFVAFEAEKTESVNAKAAFVLRERAARLYGRAHRHAMTALELNQPGLTRALAEPTKARPLQLSEEQVGLAYWAAASWGGLISLSKDQPDVVADLPQAILLAHWAWLSQPSYGQGALASLLGTFEAARPNGSVTQATQYFDQAMRDGAGAQAGPYVAKAESIALAVQDRAMFEQLLHQAVDVSTRHRHLQNEVMRERAVWLLEMTDDLF